MACLFCGSSNHEIKEGEQARGSEHPGPIIRRVVVGPKSLIASEGGFKSSRVNPLGGLLRFGSTALNLRITDQTTSVCELVAWTRNQKRQAALGIEIAS